MFCHLRLHSEFSVVDSTCRLDEVAAAAAADGQPALAITDLGNLFGAIKFTKATRALGVKPLIGAEVTVIGLCADPLVQSRILLLVQGQQGYLNLCELLTRAWTQSAAKTGAVCRRDWLAELGAGLIALSGAQAGPVGQALAQAQYSTKPLDLAPASTAAQALAALFPSRFYLELQRAGRPDDEAHTAATVQLAARLGLPVVATQPVQFMQPDDYEAHEARVCISEGEILGNPRRLRKFTREQYFKSQAQMQALFADVPSALANTVAIAQRCSLSLELGKSHLPDYPTPLVNGQPLPIADYFRQASQDGLSARMLRLYPDAVQRQAELPRYQARLDFEISTILNMGFPGYFLIVSDFIHWAKSNGCPVGPGRGSGAGSLVAYALQITDLDPLQYKLLFERFLNPERVSMPDFDIDFCQGNRERVIDYVKAKYGKQAVSQIVTFGTMAARAAIRDVGRVLDMSYTFCDGISKLVPNKPGVHITIEGAIKAEPILAARLEKEEDVKTLLTLAQKLEGLTRNVGMHAGGVLIAPGKLTDFCPLYQQPGSDSAVSQFDKDDVESAGLVKFDFLGLATLTILEQIKDFIIQRHPGQAQFSFDAIPLDDARTYKLFADGKTEAVFQFESRGMQGMLRDAKPTRLEDLIAMNALYRPGPMDLIPTYIARKLGREPVEYPDPRVEEILSETYGVMVYQEQVMLTAQILGGYSLGGADLLRRAMGKKKAEEMAKHRGIFRAGAAKNGIQEAKADEVFDLMEKFAGYGFNKSHAAAYSLLAYHTGWLKRHYTAEFFCANMTVEMDDTDKLKALFEDATKNFGLSFEPPDINRGQYRFEPISDSVIRYGLGAVKGTGQQAIEAIVAARELQSPGGNAPSPSGSGGAFTGLHDFCARVDKSRLNKRTVEALIKAGAFDSLQRNRAALLASVDQAFDYAAAQLANANQGGLFDMGGDSDHGDNGHGSSSQIPALAEVSPWGVRERLGHEKSALGFFISGHLFEESALEVRQFVRRDVASASGAGQGGKEAGQREGPQNFSVSKEPVLLVGILSDFRVINGQRGKLALFKLDDQSGVIEGAADEALVNANKAHFKDDELVIVRGKLQPDRFSGGMRLNVNEIWNLAQARCRFGRYLRVAVGSAAPDIARLVHDFAPQREMSEQGELLRGLGVRLVMQRQAVDEPLGAVAEVQLGEAANFFPSDVALASWRAQALAGQAVVVYD